MSMPALLQGVVIAMIVAWAIAFALRKLFPVTSRRSLAAIAQRFDRPASPGWLRAVARFVEPHASTGASCSDGCSSCGGCGTAETKPAVEALPLAFRQRAKR